MQRALDLLCEPKFKERIVETYRRPVTPQPIHKIGEEVGLDLEGVEW